MRGEDRGDLVGKSESRGRVGSERFGKAGVDLSDSDGRGCESVAVRRRESSWCTRDV